MKLISPYNSSHISTPSQIDSNDPEGVRSVQSVYLDVVFILLCNYWCCCTIAVQLLYKCTNVQVCVFLFFFHSFYCF